MDPPGMLAAMETKARRRLRPTSLPFTTESVVKGKAIMLASGARDVPDLLAVRIRGCSIRARHVHQPRDKCVRPPMHWPLPTIHPEKPDEALELLKKRFDKMRSGGC